MQKSTISPVFETRMLESCGPSTPARVGNIRTAPVAADLGDLGVAERDLVAAVAGADHVLDFLLRDPAVLERDVERVLRGLRHVRAGHRQRAADDAALLVDHHRLGLRGPDVHARCVRHVAPLSP
jgi:hypothetical protein